METAFNSEKYLRIQTEKIRERLDKFPDGKLYFEMGGKFLYDGHASRVLPGFDPESKIKIFKSFGSDFDIIFCIGSPGIQEGRVWNETETYEESALNELEKMVEAGLTKPVVAVNLYDGESKTDDFIEVLKKKGYEVFIRNIIEGYPDDLRKVVGKEGYGKDEYIETGSQLVLVMALGSNAGKMSTCLGQVYLDRQKGMDSGYAKYETFPIWNLLLEHPVNIAYEAATADIEDYNVLDYFHQEEYGVKSVNYNRDVDAFPILQRLIEAVSSDSNYMHTYKSPTDMGVSNTKEGFVDEEAIVHAAIVEIERRRDEYSRLVQLGKGQQKWVDRCVKLLSKAKDYEHLGLNN